MLNNLIIKEINQKNDHPLIKNTNHYFLYNWIGT
jgi:hypothetical protein